MSEQQQNNSSHPEGQFLGGTYQRILRNTAVLSAACIMLAIPLFGWKCGLAVAAGSVLAYINFAGCTTPAPSWWSA